MNIKILDKLLDLKAAVARVESSLIENEPIFIIVKGVSRIERSLLSLYAEIGEGYDKNPNPHRKKGVS